MCVRGAARTPELLAKRQGACSDRCSGNSQRCVAIDNVSYANRGPHFRGMEHRGCSVSWDMLPCVDRLDGPPAGPRDCHASTFTQKPLSPPRNVISFPSEESHHRTRICGERCNSVFQPHTNTAVDMLDHAPRSTVFECQVSPVHHRIPIVPLQMVNYTPITRPLAYFAGCPPTSAKLCSSWCVSAPKGAAIILRYLTCCVAVDTHVSEMEALQAAASLSTTYSPNHLLP